MTKSKKSNNKTSEEVKEPKTGAKNSIIGIMLLLGVLSIGYSTTVIIIGTDGIVPMIMVIPQAILGIVIATMKFTK